MQSLRKKPTTRAPQQSNTLRRPPKSSTKGAQDDKYARRDARKSRVGDKIKKRMSMRYADNMPVISGPLDIPDVPDLPINRAGGAAVVGARMPTIPVDDDDDNDDEYDSQEPRRTAPPAIDLKVMQAENFDPDAYLKSKLSTSTEAELRGLQSSLDSSKAAASADLQRNVFTNYEEFVMISKEISTLENDMLELKEGLSEWKAMPALLNIDESTSNSSDRRRQNRSSVADLTKLYAAQLSTLHTTIEGSSKFVPSVPGRHVILEVNNAWALNPATYKVEYAVHFVLLNDQLLVAKRRGVKSRGEERNGREDRERGGRGERLVAERCWSLSEISIVDVKDSPDVSRAFRIRRGKESLVYNCDRTANKKELFSAFKTAAEELATKKRREREGEHERRRSLWAAGDRMSMFNPTIEAVPSIPSYLLSGLDPNGATSEKVEMDAKWIADFTDDLAVEIALRHWDKAIELVHEGQAKVPAMPAIAPKLAPLINTLTSALLHALSDPTLRKSSVIRLTTLLLSLKQGHLARDTFLRARGDLIKKRCRMIGFEGDVSAYVSEMALVVFTSIKHTADWYLASFKENDMASGLVHWAKGELEIFGKMFRRQVYEAAQDPKAIEESVSITRTQARRLLHDNGLDFSFLLEELIADPSAVRLPPSEPSSSASRATPPIRSSTPQQQSKSSRPSTPSSRANSNLKISAPAPFDIDFSVDVDSPGTPSPSIMPSSVPIPIPSGRTTTPRPGVPSPRSEMSASPRPRPPRSALPNPRSPSIAPLQIRSGAVDERVSGYGTGLVPPRSPAPPPRSRDRPSSSARGSGGGHM